MNRPGVNCPGVNCPGVNCPGVNCPDTITQTYERKSCLKFNGRFVVHSKNQQMKINFFDLKLFRAYTVYSVRKAQKLVESQSKSNVK